MNTTLEKLQKAVELTIEAGYQLNKEAFDFLSMIAATEDPVEVISKALKKIDSFKNKPFFIERSFLEEFVKKPETSKEAFPQPSAELAEPFTSIHLEQAKQILEGRKAFHAYAKEIETDIKIIDDPGGKLSSSGTMEDYLEYFRDRFKRIERLLRQRIDVKGAASIIDALKAPPNTKLKIIGMVTERREAKQKILLTIEDLQASATVLVPQNAPSDLLDKARMLLLDQVICLSVAKTRGNLLIAEDIILPDIAPRVQNRAPFPIYAVLTSDLHVGSAKFQREPFNRFVLWLNGKYGNEEMREIASHVKYVLIAGDVVDGIGVYPNQVKELAVKDIYEQYRLAAKLVEQIPDYIEVIIIPGNHDAPRKALPQPPISDAFLEPFQESRKVYSVGNPCTISIHNVDVLLYHGRSLDDVVSTVPGIDYTHPEKAMTLLLQSRHLAPVYGGKNPLSPEARDHLVIERVPDIFHAGHIHTLGYTNYRGVLIVNSGCWQEQTSYMRRLGLTPMASLAPVVNLQTFEVKVLSFA
ncbi:MAG: DNA-directed DNA polymerase II small subunit [Candidatus Bathyarchaeota archaeon]|nr:DNA-directed DNA polymerase II small subunit [Candidatus Bathyarchaeota archaeon]